MKRILFVFALACFIPAPALADPVYLHREPLVFRTSLASKVGAYQDLNYFTHATGVSTLDTTKAISIRCVRPKPDLNAVGGAGDSLLWLRFVIVPSGTGSHAMAVAPTITVQTLQTTHTGAAAITNATASAMTLCLTAYTVADTSWSKALSYGTVAANIGASTGSWVRAIFTGSIIGDYVGWVEYWTSCPVVVNGAQP